MAKLKTPILLVIEREGEERRLEEFHENIIKIGKLSSVNLKLDDPDINRIHAVLEVTGEDEAQIIDMGSSKGTRVNGKRIHKTKIASGDQILLGMTNIIVFIGETAVAQARVGNFEQASDEAVSSDATAVAHIDQISGSGQSGADAGSYGGSVDAQADLMAGYDDEMGASESTQIVRNPLSNPQQITGQHTAPAPAAQQESYDSADTARVSPEAAAAVQQASSYANQSDGWDASTQAGQLQDIQQFQQQQQQAEQAAAYAAQQAAEQQAAAYAAQQQAEQAAAYAAQQQAEQAAAYAAQQQAEQAAAYAAQQQAEQAAAYAAQQQQAQAAQQAAAMAAQQQANYMTGGFGAQQAPAGFPNQAQQPAPQYGTGGFGGYPQQQQPGGFAPAPVQQAQTMAPMAPQGMTPAGVDEASYGDSQEVLEVRVMWGDTILDHAHFYDPKRITVGESRKNTFSISSEALPAEIDSYPLIEADGDRLQINFTDSMSGMIQIKDQNFTLDQIKQSAKVQKTANGYQFALPAQSKVQLLMGDVTFLISFVPAPKRIPPSVLTQMDHHLARSMGASFLIHGILILFMLFSDEAPQGLSDDFFKQPNRFAQLIIRPEEPEKKKKKKDDGGGAKAKGKEGKMGKKKAPKAENRRSGQIKKNPDGTAPIDMQKVEKALQDKIGKKGILGLLGGGNKAYGAILTAKGFGGDDADAIGGWNGAKVGDAAGGGGLGLRGGGGGGGGFSGTSVGLGRLGTYGRGGGKGGRGWGRGGLRRKRKRSVEVSTGPPVVFGALDKEIIRRVINQHRSQIKYCYERELIKHPKLAGKIKVFFVISGTGRVSSSKVSQSTMNNDRVEDCIVRRVRFWRFPAPKGNGIVHVNYPFYFKPS